VASATSHPRRPGGDGAGSEEACAGTPVGGARRAVGAADAAAGAQGSGSLGEETLSMRVVVVGLGYVGSVCSACLADHGHDVVGVDTSEFKVSCIREGRSPIVERGLPELIERAAGAGRLMATTRITDAMPGADVALVCVGTPSAEDGSL